MTRDVLKRRSNLECCHVDGDWTSWEGLSRLPPLRSVAGTPKAGMVMHGGASNYRVTHTRLLDKLDFLQGALPAYQSRRIPRLQGISFAPANQFTLNWRFHYQPPSARVRLRRLIHYFAAHHHSRDGHQQYWKARSEGEDLPLPKTTRVIPCNTGKAFSSDPIGDGPSKLRFIPRPGCVVFIDWRTFPDSQDTPLTDIPWPMVRGVYSGRKTKAGWAITFSCLRGIYYMPDSWVAAHGTRTQRPPISTLVTYKLLQGASISPAALNIEHLILSDGTPGVTPLQPASDNQSEVYMVPALRIEGETGTNKNLESTNLGVCFLNINGVVSTKAIQVGRYFWQLGCGITFLIDTRTSIASHDYHRLVWKACAGSKSTIHFSDQHRTASVGGQLALLDPYWSSKIISKWSDPSGLGLVFEIVLSTYEGAVRVISVYWPTNSDLDSNGLRAKTHRWLASINRAQSVDEYVRSILAARLKKPAYRKILLGDFNKQKDSLPTEVADLADAHEGCNFASRYLGTAPCHKIDFLLHTGHLVSSGFSTDHKWQEYSDHRPLWAIFPSSGPKVRIKLRAKMRVNKSLKSSEAIQEYQQALEPLQFHRYTPAEALTQICNTIKASSTEMVRQRPIGLWSPYTGAMLIRQKLLKDLIKETSIPILWRRVNIETLLHRAEEHTRGMGKDGDAMWEEICTTPLLLSTEQLRSATTVGDATSLQSDLARTAGLLHGRRRKERLEDIREKIRRIQEDKYRFFKTMGKKRIQTDLTQLITPAGTLHNPAQIDQALADHWQGAFAAPIDSFIPSWDSTTYQDLQNAYPAIPAKLTRQIWDAIKSVPETIRKSVGEDLKWDSITPTASEYLLQLKLSSKDSAGGPSGATYRLLQLLPVQTQLLLYKASLACWNSRTLPELWNKKLLFLLNKKEGIHTIKNIRPIVLLEVTRKLWFKVITKKIAKSLENHMALQPNQYGFRVRRSTTDNLVQLVNAIEARKGLGIAASSFDIVGAFNAPPRKWIEFSLRRVGVPEELSRILSTLDAEEEISLLTPHRLEHGTGATFSTGRGCGQGDVISPLLWMVFFDIVLTALNQTPSGIHYADSAHCVHQVVDTVFADDLLAIGGTHTCIQQKADTMSACGIIMGFTLAPDKLRSFSTIGDGELLVHTAPWDGVSHPFSVDGFIKYLGSTIDVNGSYAEEARLIIAALRTTIDRIHPKTHSAEHSRQYMQGAVTPQLEYAAKMGALPVRILNRIQIQLNGEYKDHAHLNKSFPSAILHAPLKAGGMGLSNFKDKIGNAKWGMVERSLTGPSRETRWAMEGILARAAREDNLDLIGSTSSLAHVEGRWLGDITRLLEQIEAKITHYHGLEVNTLDSPLQDISTDMERLGIRKTADVVVWTGQRYIPLPPSAFGLTSQLWGTATWWPDSPTEILISPGQYWAKVDCPDTIFETIGWQGQRLLVQSWAAPNWTPSRRSSTLWRREEIFSMANPTQHLAYKCTIEVFTQAHIKLYYVALSPCQRRSILRSAATQPVPEGATIASDGSYAVKKSIFQEWEVGDTYGGISVTDSSRPYQRIRGVRFRAPCTGQRVFTTELSAMALGLKLYSSPLHTDCQGALAAIAGHTTHGMQRIARHNAIYSPPPVAPIAPPIYQPEGGIYTSSTGIKSFGRVHWVPSHPEDRKLPANWLPAEQAIYEADSVAAGEGIFEEISFAAATNEIFANSRQWIATSAEGALLETPLQLKQTLDLKRYLDLRTKFGKQVWSSAGLAFVANTAGTIRQRAALIKLHIGHYLSDLQYAQGTRPRCCCGCRNILRDWLGVCNRPEVKALNQGFLVTLSHLTIPRELALALYKVLEAPENVLLFRGIWTSSNRAAVESAFSSRPFATIRTWRKGVKLITTALVSHALALQGLSRTPATLTVDPHPLVAHNSTVDAPGSNQAFDIYSVPFTCDIRPNPSWAKPRSAEKKPETKSKRAKGGSRLPQRTINEFFPATPRLTPPPMSLSLKGVRRLQVPNHLAINLPTKVVTLTPRLRPDIRFFFGSHPLDATPPPRPPPPVPRTVSPSQQSDIRQWLVRRPP